MRPSRLSRLACLALILCLYPAASPLWAAEPIRIGVAGPESGDLASYGIPTLNAVRMLAKEANAKGGVLGRQIEVLAQDDVCKPEIAANVAAKLVSDHVDLVIGPICSGATRAALGIYKDARKVVISPSATNPDLTQNGKYPNFFRTIASDDTQARQEVDFAVKKLGLKRLAVIHDKGDYGKGLAEFAKRFVEAGPAKLVLFEGVTPGAVDYSAIVQKIKHADADGVIFGGYHPEASKIVTQMRKRGMQTAFISDDGVKDDTFIKVAGPYAEGVYASGPQDTSKNPMTKIAIDSYKKEYGVEPGAFYLNAYAATLAAFNAIDKAGSTDFDALVKTLRNAPVDTPLGSIRFDERGDALGVGFAMYVVKSGVYQEVQ